MRNPPRIQKIIGAALLASVVFTPLAATAQFSPSDSRLFIDAPDFQVAPQPGQQFEIAVYAIIDGPVALYTIFSANRFNYAVLGAFQCNVEFSLLKSSSNGLYDIRCTDENVFNKPTTYIVKFDGGSYVQDFSTGK